MRLLTREQSIDLDQRAGPLFRPDELMELAGLALWDFLKTKQKKNAALLVLAGPGNNGGDGWILARIAAQNGWGVEVQEWLRSSRSELLQEKKAAALTAGVKLITDVKDARAMQTNASAVVVDAIVGTGMNRPWDAEQTARLTDLVSLLRKTRVRVLAVDTPSGLDVNTGLVLGIAVPATWTVTMGAAKPGFFIEQGPATTGRLKIAKLPYPKDLLKEVASSTFLFGAKAAHQVWPVLGPRGNKSTNGRLFIAAGSSQFPGAALLACRAALRSGVGYLEWTTRGEWIKTLSAQPDILYRPWDWSKPFKADAVVIGPGLGQGPETQAGLQAVASWDGPVLIDADALTEWQKMKRPKPSTHRRFVLTPHTGELARLMEVTNEEVGKDRGQWARAAAQRYHAVVVAKGYRTLVTDGTRTAVIFAGNKALAKAGSGDVLSGFIGSFLAKKMEPFLAACLGAYLHGALADEWVRAGRPSWAFLPTDMLENKSSTWDQVLEHILTKVKI